MTFAPQQGPGDLTPTAGLAGNYTRMGKRLLGINLQGLNFLQRFLTPVQLVGLPDFADAERAFFFAGGQDNNPGGGFASSVGISSTVEIAVFFVSAYSLSGGAVVGSILSLFTPEPGFDPFSAAHTDTNPALRPDPNSSQGHTVVRSGRSAAFTARSSARLLSAGVNGPTQFSLPSPIILPAGQVLCLQETVANVSLQATFGYRELAG